MVIKHWPMAKPGSLGELTKKLDGHKVRRIVVNWETIDGKLSEAREEYFGITKLFNSRYNSREWYYGAIGLDNKATLYIYL